MCIETYCKCQKENNEITHFPGNPVDSEAGHSSTVCINLANLNLERLMNRGFKCRNLKQNDKNGRRHDTSLEIMPFCSTSDAVVFLLGGCSPAPGNMQNAGQISDSAHPLPEPPRNPRLSGLSRVPGIAFLISVWQSPGHPSGPRSSIIFSVKTVPVFSSRIHLSFCCALKHFDYFLRIALTWFFCCCCSFFGGVVLFQKFSVFAGS